MSNLQFQNFEFQLNLTPREFSLVTKALCGTLDHYTWKEGTAHEKNDLKEATELGERLLKQNVATSIQRLDMAQKCLAAMEDRKDDQEDK